MLFLHCRTQYLYDLRDTDADTLQHSPNASEPQLPRALKSYILGMCCAMDHRSMCVLVFFGVLDFLNSQYLTLPGSWNQLVCGVAWYGWRNSDVYGVMCVMASAFGFTKAPPP